MKDRLHPVVVLFGHPCAGKNFVGRILEVDYGYHFYDADADLPEKMRQKYASGQLPDEADREEYYRTVIDNIRIFATAFPKLAVAQALHRDKYRCLINEEFHPLFIRVASDQQLVIDRLRQRQNHPLTPASAREIINRFEPCSVEYVTLTNDSDQNNIRTQLSALLSE